MEHGEAIPVFRGFACTSEPLDHSGSGSGDASKARCVCFAHNELRSKSCFIEVANKGGFIHCNRVLVNLRDGENFGFAKSHHPKFSGACRCVQPFKGQDNALLARFVARSAVRWPWVGVGLTVA